MFKVLSIHKNERIDPRLLQKIGKKLSQTIDHINCNPYQSERTRLSLHYENSISTPADLSDASFEYAPIDIGNDLEIDNFWNRDYWYKDQKKDRHG